MEKQKPIKKFIIGDITTAIWKNEGKNSPFFSITTTRRYKKDGKWNDTASLGRYDLLKSIQLQARALSWMDYSWIDDKEKNVGEEPEQVEQ